MVDVRRKNNGVASFQHDFLTTTERSHPSLDEVHDKLRRMVMRCCSRARGPFDLNEPDGRGVDAANHAAVIVVRRGKLANSVVLHFRRDDLRATGGGEGRVRVFTC